MDEATPETRICRKCGDSKPLDQFSVGRATCKTCQAAYKRDLRKGILHPQTKPEVRICRECRKPETEVEFRPKANICVPCFKIYLANYRNENRDKLRKQVRDWKDTNREQLRETNRKLYHTPEGKAMHRARVCKTPRTWLSHLLSITRANSIKPGPHDPKSGPKRDFDLDLDYVVSLYESQQGKCAITGVKMTHTFNDMNAMSIDRIDPEQGHIKGNIHLICQWANFAKRHHKLAVFRRALSDFMSVMYQRFLGGARMSEPITANAQTLMNQAPATVDVYLTEAVKSIDDHLGKGYSQKNPGLVAAFIQTCAIDLGCAVLAQQLRAGLENIRIGG